MRTVTRRAKIVSRLPAGLGLLACVGVGWSLCFGLIELHAVGGRHLEVFGIGCGLVSVGVLFRFMVWFGHSDQRDQRGWMALFGCYVGGELAFLPHIAGALRLPWGNGLLAGVLVAVAGLLVGIGVRRVNADLIFFLHWLLIPAGCLALGSLLGYGVVGVNSTKGVLFALLDIPLKLLTTFVLVAVIKWFGISDLRGRTALHTYMGAQVGALTHADLIHHWSWWVYMVVLGIGNVMIARGLASREWSGESGFLDLS